MDHICRRKRSTACQAMIISLVVCLTSGPMCVKGQTRQNYLSSPASSNPIGVIRSAAQVKVNGRLTEGGQLIWNGDVLETLASDNSRVSIDAVGEVELMSQTKVRLSAAFDRLDDKPNHVVLVAVLMNGDLAIRLNPEASAYIEACGQRFTSDEGAIFRIRTRGGNPVVDAERGVLKTAPRYFGRELRVDLVAFSDLKTNQPLQVSKVKLHKSAVIKAQVVSREKPKVARHIQLLLPVSSFTGSQAVDDWKPVGEGEVVIFELTNPIGTLNQRPGKVEVTTDRSGLARVTFIGERKGTTTVTATVKATPPDTSISTDLVTITVIGTGIFTRRNSIILGALVVIGTYPLWMPKKKDIQQIPPPQIIP